MTFEYRDAYGRVLTADHGLDDDDNPMAVLWARGEYGVSVPVRIPAAHVEEVVAGIRDAARQTTGQPKTDDIGLCGYCGVPRENHHHGYTSTADVIAASPYSLNPDGEDAPAVGQPAEAQPADEAHPADVTFAIEKRGDTDWLMASSHYDEADREKALSRLARRREQYPDTEFRIVRETTTWTVEDER